MVTYNKGTLTRNGNRMDKNEMELEALWHLQSRGAKFKDFPIKLKTFIFTNSKSKNFPTKH